MLHAPTVPQTFPLEISPLTVADLDSVMALESASFPTPWSRATYHNELTRNRRSRYLKVAPVIASRARAPAISEKQTALPPPRAGLPAPALVALGGIMLFGAEMHIVTIAVLPAWRGRSIGEWLLLALLTVGRESGAETATLEVRVSNEIAQRLYRKLDFAAVGYRRRYYPDKEDACILALADLRSRRVWEPLRERFERLSALMQCGVDVPGIAE